MATMIVTFTLSYSSSAGCSRGREEARRRLFARGQVARLVLILSARLIRFLPGNKRSPVGVSFPSGARRK